MKRKSFTPRFKHNFLAVSASALMLGASQAGTTVGLNFQAQYYSGAPGYAAYQTTGFPVTGNAFGVDAANWSNSPLLPSTGPYGAYNAYAQLVTAITFGPASSLTANVTAPNTWMSGIGNLSTTTTATVAPGNDEVTWGYLTDGVGWPWNKSGLAPAVSVSGLAAQFPHGYVIETIAAVGGAATFNNIDFSDGSTTETGVIYSTYTAGVGTHGSGTVGLAVSGGFTGDTLNINPEAQTSGNRSTLAGFILTDQPLLRTQPADDVSLTNGQPFSLNVGAIGVPPLAYIWRTNGVPIGGAPNSPIYTNSGVTLATAGNYDVVVTNISGAVTSSVAMVGIYAPHAPETLTWDSDTMTPGPQDGSGIWNYTPAQWWNGTSDDTWWDTSTAIFGAGDTNSYTVTLLGNNMSAAGISFNSGDYTIANTAGETLTLLGTGTITANADATINAPLVGTNSLTKTGSGTLTLGAAGTYIGGTTVSQGTLQLNNATAAGTGAIVLGDANTGANNVQLNINALPAYAITVANQGSGTATIDCLQVVAVYGGSITLNRDVIMLDNGGSWVVPPSMSGNGNVTWLTPSGGATRWAPSGTFTYVGSNSVQGLIQVQSADAFGNLSNSVTLSGSGMVNLYSAGINIGALNGDAANNLSCNNGAASRTVNLGNGGGSGVFAGVMSDASGHILNLTKNGSGTEVLSGANTYTGNTTVNGGNLLIDTAGALGSSPVTVASGGAFGVNGYVGGAVQSGGRLYGAGTIAGAITIQSGGTLAPGGASAIGTLTEDASSAPLTTSSGGTNYFRISKTGGVLTNDMVLFAGGGTVTYGGVLVVTNVTTDGNQIQPTDVFYLFTGYPSSYTGSFVVSPQNMPVPPAGYSWDLSHLTVDGSLRLAVQTQVTTPVINPPSGGYVGSQMITISCATPSATIHYSTDNWTTTNTYSGAIALSGNTNLTIQAYATANSLTPSAPASATYNTELVAVWLGSQPQSSYYGGSWATASNWTNNIVPNNANATVDFSTLSLSNEFSDATVTLDGQWTVGNLIFGDTSTNYNWVLNDGGTGTDMFTLAASNPPAINVVNQTTTINVPVSGVGGLTKTGNGTLVLAGDDSYSGDTVISQGTLSINNSAGASAGNIQLGDNNTGASAVELDLNAGIENSVIVSSNGTNTATINCANAAISSHFTLNRPTTFGSTVGFGPAQMSGNVGTLTLNGPASGAGIRFWGTFSSLTGTVVLASGNMSTWPDRLPTNTPVNITGTNSVYYLGDAQSGVTHIGALNGVATVSVVYDQGGSAYNQTLSVGNDNGSGNYAGAISDGSKQMSFIKAGTGSETLSGTNTYTGTTTVNGGILFVDGSIASTNSVSVVSTGTLGGIGTVGGTVTSDGTLSPGDAGIGTLTLGSVHLNSDATAYMEINKSSSPPNDVLVASSIAYAGTLTVVNRGGAGTLANGDSFQLFSAGSQSGDFSVKHLPALSGGLQWNWDAASGILSVGASSVATNPTNILFTVTGNTLNLSWPADHLGWHLQYQTNSLTTGLSANWTTIPGSDTITSTNITINPAEPTMFYRMVYP